MSRKGRIACTAQQKATVLLTVANAAPRPRRTLQDRRKASQLSRATGAWAAGAKNLRAAIDTRDQIDWIISDQKRRPLMPMTQRAPVHGVARRGKSDCCLCVTRVAIAGKTHATARTSGQINHFAARKKVENRYAKPIVIQIPKTARAKTGRRSTHQESGPGAQTTTGNAIEQMPEPNGMVWSNARTKTRRVNPRNQRVEHKVATLAIKNATGEPNADNADQEPQLTCPTTELTDPTSTAEADSGTAANVIASRTETRQTPTYNACGKGVKPKALDGQKRNTTSAAERRYAAGKDPRDERGATYPTNRGIVKRTPIATAIGRKNQPSHSPARLDTEYQHNLMADKRKPP